MSMTVRYPTGLAVTYNDANFLTHGNNQWILSTADPDKGGRKLAFIQQTAGVVVEFVPACRAEFTTLTVFKAAQLLADKPEELRRLQFSTLRDLKRALTGFNSKTGEWR